MSEIRGGCYCGAIRYVINGEIEQCLVCHCPDCRRFTGAQSVAYIFLRTENYTLVKGVPAEYASSKGVIRKFAGLAEQA